MQLRSTLITLIILCHHLITYCFAQESLKDDHTVKINQSINPYEYGTSISYQYYITKRLGFQTNIGIVQALDEGTYTYQNEYRLKGMGLRLNPELRFYPRRRMETKFNSFFIGGGPIIKTMKMDEQSWNVQYDPYSMNNYLKQSITTYKNISYGLMGTLGVEGYLGKSKRFLFDVAYSFGLTNNHVKQSGDLRNDTNRFFEDGSVSNRSSGILPYIDIRVGLGYRIGKKL